MRKFLFLTVVVSCLLSVTEISSQTHYYLRSNLTAPTSLAAWTQDPTGATAVNTPTTFGGLNVIWHFRNRTTATVGTLWNINAASTASVENGINVTVSGTGPTGGQINGLIDIAAGGTVTVQNNKTYKWNLLDLNSSTVVFNFSGAFLFGSVNQFGNVIINQNTSLNGATTDIYINGLLTINGSSLLSFNGYGIYLAGTNGMIAGTGFFSSDAAGFLLFLGGNGGNNGTINFATSTGTIGGLYYLFNSGSDFIRLGSNVVITNSGSFQQITGSCDLNGKSLTIDASADISLPAVSADGVFFGSNTSAIIINGTIGNFSPNGTSIFMDATNNTLGGLTINGGASLNAGNTLNIADSLTISGGSTFNTNGNVTLVSTNTLKGRLGRFNGTIGGNLTVQTFAKSGLTDWTNLGVSGISGQTFNNWYGQIPMAIEGSSTGVTSTSNTYFESVQGWNEADTYGYDTTIVVTSPITPGKGFWVFLGTGLTSTSDMLWTVSGTPVTGPQNINLTNSTQAGWNLIANPFASPINWNSVMASNPGAQVNDAYYIYDPDLGNSVSFINGVASPGSYSGMADIIPMGQGFYVEATGNTSLTFDEVNKSNQNTTLQPLLKNNNTVNTNNNIGSVIRLNLNGGGWCDDAAIRFHSNATTSFDKSLDARKLYNSPGYAGYPGEWTKRTVIATQSNNEDYSINSLPYAQTQSAVIPVIVRVYSTGQYTISGSGLNNLPPNACVVLKDKLLNTTQDLRLGNYVCNINDTTYAARFELTICADVTADVKSLDPVKAENAININKDAKGVFVNFDFEKATNANIIVTNVLGQKIMDTKKVKTSKDKIYLDLNTSEQLIFVTVETENEKVTKKFLNFN
ncbi:MAG: hypothetical protein ACK50A_07565 [Sphingobacteriaceae bacterium]